MSISSSIIQFCYKLDDSKHYKRIKGFFYDLIDNPRSRIRPYFDVAMITPVVSSVYLIIYEVNLNSG